MNDGIYGMLPRALMAPEAVKFRGFYEMKPDAPVIMREFGFYSLERWIAEGRITNRQEIDKMFHFDLTGRRNLQGVGWCEAAFMPAFEETILEDRGEYELVRDYAGRQVLCFKGRRSGFMPEYCAHPVKDIKSWEEDVAWRLDPNTKGRLEAEDDAMAPFEADAGKGYVMSQRVIGAYMYLRSLIGPLDLLYKFYDEPELIHRCMEAWLKLADTITAVHQRHVTLDEVFFGEDICYKNGCLISSDMFREFLAPYYQELIRRVRSRQLDKNRKIHIQIDTDGFCDPVIPLYKELLGVDYFSPFEGAAGCDVVRTANQYPELLMSGGMDKRVLAEGPEAIDRMVDRIMPVMKRRGGYIPTCDHGVPEEVSFENYCHFRERLDLYR